MYYSSLCCQFVRLILSFVASTLIYCVWWAFMFYWRHLLCFAAQVWCYEVLLCNQVVKTLYSTTHYSVSAHADLVRHQRVTVWRTRVIVLELVLLVACVFWSQCVVTAAGVSEWGLLSIMLGCWKGLRLAGPPIQPATAGGSNIPPALMYSRWPGQSAGAGQGLSVYLQRGWERERRAICLHSCSVCTVERRRPDRGVPLECVCWAWRICTHTFSYYVSYKTPSWASYRSIGGVQKESTYPQGLLQRLWFYIRYINCNFLMDNSKLGMQQ